MDSLSIVIPAFNEESRLGPTLSAIIDYAERQGGAIEIIVIDDGSTDRTPELVREFATTSPVVRLIQNEGNRGKGYSIRRAVREASGDVVLMTDADHSVPIEQAERLFSALTDGAAVAIGSRALRRDLWKFKPPVARRVYSSCFRVLVRFLLGLRFSDTQCGFKAFTREAAGRIFALLTVDNWAFDPEILILADLLDYRVAEVPVEAYYRPGSKVRPFRDSLQTLQDLLAIRLNAYRHVRRWRADVPQVVPQESANDVKAA